jgi:hypothetical protein
VRKPETLSDLKAIESMSFFFAPWSFLLQCVHVGIAIETEIDIEIEIAIEIEIEIDIEIAIEIEIDIDIEIAIEIEM